MPGKHAILSPSGASRWLACTPSARLEQRFPNSSSAASDEGTLAHSLGELLIRFKTKQISKLTYNKDLAVIKANKYYDEAMMEHCDNYAVFIVEQLSAAQAHTKDAILLLEQELDLTAYVPEGFGTGDSFIIADRILRFTDLKYGKGVPVSADNNKQMMLYSLGALDAYGHMYDIDTVHMTIYQPRLDNISTFEMTVTDLKEWAEKELKPKAVLAFAGEGEFAPGDACRFCRAKALCKANAEYNLELAQYDFKDGNLLEDADISDILSRADNFIKWLSSVNEYALSEAVNNSKKWPGYKLVEGKSNRVFTDKDAILAVLLEKGHYKKEEVTAPATLLGITALEKVIGKGDFETHVSTYVVKPPGKPTLVPASDKRPEYHSAEGAANDFAGIMAEEN